MVAGLIHGMSKGLQAEKLAAFGLPFQPVKLWMTLADWRSFETIRVRGGVKVDISEVLKPELMKFDMEAREKRQAILELAQLMWEHGYVEDLQGLVDATMAREAEYSTGIGMGVAYLTPKALW